MDSRTKSSTPRDLRHSESARRVRNSKTDTPGGPPQNGLSTSASPREKKTKKKSDGGQRIDGEEGPSSASHLSLLAEQQSQNRDPENDKTTDEFLQFIADPAADEEKKIEVKEKG